MSDGKLKMSTIFVLEIKGAKISNFLIGRFFVMGGPMHMSFGMFLKTNVRLLKWIMPQFFSKYSKSYNILNAKSCLNLEGAKQKDGPF